MIDREIQKKQSLEIHQVTNGYLVFRSNSEYEGRRFSIETAMVFQTFAALVEWLSHHYTHRAEHIPSDLCVPPADRD